MSVDKVLQEIRKELVTIKTDLLSVKKDMATKGELASVKKDLASVKKNMATKSDLADTKKELKAYTDEVAKEILQAVSDHNDAINDRLDEMELKFVTRREFEALKRKVEQLRPVN